MDSITIATLGDSVDFGNCTSGMGMKGNCNATRGVWAGFHTPSVTNIIEFVTIATRDTTDFGDLTQARTFCKGSGCSPTRGVWAGGATSRVNTIDHVELATTGNALDFGDIATGQMKVAVCQMHGGL